MNGAANHWRIEVWFDAGSEEWCVGHNWGPNSGPGEEIEAFDSFESQEEALEAGRREAWESYQGGGMALYLSTKAGLVEVASAKQTEMEGLLDTLDDERADVVDRIAQAAAWISEGFSAENASGWMDHDIWDPRVAAECVRAGLEPEEIRGAIEDDLIFEVNSGAIPAAEIIAIARENRDKESWRHGGARV